MALYDSARRRIDLGAELARGGEGLVYAVTGQPNVVAKVYTPHPREGHEEKLRWMSAHPPRDPGRAHQAIAWPRDLLYDGNRRFTGFLMPYVRNAVPVLQAFNPRTRALTWPRFDRRYLHRTARNVAAALAALHESSYVVGDLNESNVLVTPQALVTLIDTDSFQVQEPREGRIIVYPCPVAKPEYTPPEIQGLAPGQTLRNSQHDTFALAVLIFQLLMEGSHPFRARWLAAGDPPSLQERVGRGYFPYDSRYSDLVVPPPGAPALDLLHPGLVELVRRCFIEGQTQPLHRPTAQEWERALARAETELVPCPNGHFYGRHVGVCPVCGGTTAAHTTAPRRRPQAAMHNPAPRIIPPVAPPPPTSAPRPPAGAAQSTGTPAAAHRTATTIGRPPTRTAPASSQNSLDSWARLGRSLMASFMGRPAPTPPPAAPFGSTFSLWRLFLRAAGGFLTGAVLAPAPTSGGARTVLAGNPCPRCGRLNGVGEIYCQSCIIQLAGETTCPQCDRLIPANSRYCPHCAVRLA